jgi:hypothetical protein
MAELPEHVKAQADKVVAEAGANKMAVKDLGVQDVADWNDPKAMEAAREQQRQNALQEKTPEPEQPDRE